MPQPLSDGVVVITGASSGIGRSAARMFAARGSAVVPYPLPGPMSLAVREAAGVEWHGLE